MKKSSRKKTSTKSKPAAPASALALPPAVKPASSPLFNFPPQPRQGTTAADLLAILRYANTANLASTLTTGTTNMPAAASAIVHATPEDPTLATDMLTDNRDMAALIHRTRNIIGIEATEKILQYAVWKGRDQGHKLGYDEGYHEATGYGIIDANNGWEAGYTEGYELGLEEGKMNGRLQEKEDWASNHGEGLCASLKASTARIQLTTDAATQTTSTSTVNAVTQMALQDEPPHPLRDAGTSTATTSMSQTTPCRTVFIPPSSPTPATSRPTTPTHPITAMSRLPTPSTTATTVAPPPSEPPPAPQKRRHTLPSRPTAPLQPPQPLLPCPEPRRPAATSQPTTVTNPAATMPQTTTWASSSTQTTITTMETATHAPDSPQRRCATPDTLLREVVWTRSSERVVHSTEQLCQPHRHQRRPRRPPTPPRLPQLSPQAPFTQPNAPIDVATSRPPTPTPSAATTLRTAPRATTNAQMATTAPEAATHAPKSPRRPSTVQQTELRDYAQTRLSERVVYSTKPPCSPHRRQRRSRSCPSPLCSPQFVPLPPVSPESPSRTARSPSTRLSMTTEFPMAPRTTDCNPQITHCTP
jgi:hypothetical protein